MTKVMNLDKGFRYRLNGKVERPQEDNKRIWKTVYFSDFGKEIFLTDEDLKYSRFFPEMDCKILFKDIPEGVFNFFVYFLQVTKNVDIEKIKWYELASYVAEFEKLYYALFEFLLIAKHCPPGLVTIADRNEPHLANYFQEEFTPKPKPDGVQ